MRGTKVIHVWTFQYPHQGGVGTHSVLSRIWRTLSYTMKCWYNLGIHVLEVSPKNCQNRMRGTWVIHVRTFKDPFKGGSEHTQRFAESERLRIKPPTFDTIYKYMHKRYCKRNFEKRMRGTWVINVQISRTPFKGGQNTLNALQNLNDFELHPQTLPTSLNTCTWVTAKGILKIEWEEQKLF